MEMSDGLFKKTNTKWKMFCDWYEENMGWPGTFTVFAVLCVLALCYWGIAHVIEEDKQEKIKKEEFVQKFPDKLQKTFTVSDMMFDSIKTDKDFFDFCEKTKNISVITNDTVNGFERINLKNPVIHKSTKTHSYVVVTLVKQVGVTADGCGGPHRKEDFNERYCWEFNNEGYNNYIRTDIPEGHFRNDTLWYFCPKLNGDKNDKDKPELGRYKIVYVAKTSDLYIKY